MHNMLRIAGLAFALLFAALPAHAQTGSPKSATVLNLEVNTLFPDNISGLITPFDQRQTLLDIISSFGNTSIPNTWTSLQTFDAGIVVNRSNTSAVAIYNAIYTGSNTLFDGAESVLGTSTNNFTQANAVNGSYVNGTVAATLTGNVVGLYAAGQCTVSSSACWGINTILMDNATRATGSLTGIVLVNELDFNVMNTGTQVIGLSLGGNSLAQSTNAVGVIVNTLGTGMKWQTGFYCIDGAVSSFCLAAGPISATGTNVKSTQIIQQYLDGGGTKQTLTLQGTTGGWNVGTTETNFSLVFQQPGSSSIFGGVSTSSGLALIGSATGGSGDFVALRAATQFFESQDGMTIYAKIGPGLQVGSPTGADKGGGTINIQGAIWTNGIQGVASTTCTVTAGNTLVFTNGLLTTKGANCT